MPGDAGVLRNVSLAPNPWQSVHTHCVETHRSIDAALSGRIERIADSRRDVQAALVVGICDGRASFGHYRVDLRDPFTRGGQRLQLIGIGR